MQLMEKMESVIKRMRWKAYYFLNCNNNKNDETENETFEFKSKYHPRQLKELENFEKDLFDIVNCLKFRNVNDNFQEQMKSDLSDIKASPDVLMFADKTSNIYKVPPQVYKKLLKENITKKYKKSPERLEKAINMEAENISKKTPSQ